MQRTVLLSQFCTTWQVQRSTVLCSLWHFYHATACNATHGIAVAILSAFLSVHLSIRCVYCYETKLCIASILIRRERAITLLLWHQQWFVGDAPSLWNLHSKWPTFVRNWSYRVASSSYAFGRWRFSHIILAWWIALRLALHRTTGSADNCTMDFLDVSSRTVCQP